MDSGFTGWDIGPTHSAIIRWKMRRLITHLDRATDTLVQRMATDLAGDDATAPRLTRQMGWAGCLTFHLLIGGMLASALLHPLILLFFISAGITFYNQTVAIIPQEVLALFILDTTNLMAAMPSFSG